MYYYKLGTMKFPDFTQRMMEDYFDAGKLDAKGNTAWKEEHPSRTDIPDFPAKEKPEDMSVSGGKFVFEDSFWHPDRNDIHPDMRPVSTFGGLTFVDREAGQVYVSDTHRVDVYQNVSEEEVKAVLRGYNKTHNIRLDSMDAPLHDITVAMLESGELKPEAVEKAVKTHKAASGAKSRTAVKEDTARELQTALKTLAFKDRIKDKRNTIVLARQGGEVRAYGHDARLLNELTDVKSKTIKTFKKEGSRNVPGKGIFTAAVPKDEEDSVVRYFAESEDRGYDVVVIDADNGFRKCNEMKGNILERNNRISAARNKGLYYLPVAKDSDLYSKESYDGIIDLFKKGDTAAILRQAKDSIGQLDDRNTYRFADELHKDCPAYDYYNQYFCDYIYIKKPYVLAENRDYAVTVMMNDDEETAQTDIDSKYREELVMYRKYTSQRLRDAMASSDYLKDNWDKIIYGDEVHEQLVTNDAEEVMKVVFRKPFIRGLVQKEKDLAATLGKGFEWNRDRDSVGLELKVPRRSRDYGEGEYYDYISSVRYDKGRLMVNNRTLTDYLLEVQKDGEGTQRALDALKDGLKDAAEERRVHDARPFYYEITGYIPSGEVPEKKRAELDGITARTGARGDLAAARLADTGKPSLGDLMDKLELDGGGIGQDPEEVYDKDDEYVTTYQPGTVYDDGKDRAFRRLSAEEVARIIDDGLDSGKVTVKDYFKLPDSIKEIFRQSEKGKAVLDNYNALKGKPTVTLDEFYGSGIFEYTKEDLSKLSTDDLRKVAENLDGRISFYDKELNESDAYDYRHSVYGERSTAIDRYDLVSEVVAEREKEMERKASGVEKTAAVSPGSKGRWHQDAQNEQREAVAEGHDPAAVLSAHDSEEPEAAEEKVETDTAREQARKEEHTEKRSGGLHM